MDQNLKDKTLENLTKAENVLIVVSPSLGFDGLAAGLALHLSLIKLDKNVSVKANLPTAGDAQRLYGVDRVGKIEGSKKPVIVVDNAVETVDKVTYYLEGSKLRIVVHPLPGTPQISKESISFEYSSSPANLIFSLGFNSLHDLRSEITQEQEINPESWIINVNNIKSSQKFAQTDFVNPDFSGISEVAAKMIQDLALPLDEDIAYNLYSGIKESTNNFSPSQATPVTFELAGWLLKFGAGKASLAENRNRFASQPQSQHQTQTQLQPSPSQNAWGKSNIYQNAPQPQNLPGQPQSNTFAQDANTIFADKTPPIEQVERMSENPRQGNKNEWLKPPKIYKGSKAFDREN